MSPQVDPGKKPSAGECYLSYRTLGKRWEVSRDTIERLCATGTLTKVFIGKRNVRFALSEVLRIEGEASV